jgi:hypothetical protein
MHHTFNADRLLLTSKAKEMNEHTEAMFKSIMRSTWPDEVRSTQLFDVPQALELPPLNLFQLDEKVLPGDSRLGNIRINKLAEKVVHVDCWPLPSVSGTALVAQLSRTEIIDGILDSAGI